MNHHGLKQHTLDMIAAGEKQDGEGSLASPCSAFANPGGDWFCDWCHKGMAEDDEGYADEDGVCFCSKECADEKFWMS